MSSEEFTVTPWSVEGEIDYDKLMQKFGTEKISPELAAWISANTCFPSTMIDRIVPATTDQDRQDIEARLGMRDEGLVVAEPGVAPWVRSRL